MATAMRYRECAVDDFARLLPLFGQMWPHQKLNMAALMAVYVRGVGAEDQCYLCAEDDGKIVGFCSLHVRSSLWQQANLGYIAELVVDEAARGKGIGTHLLSGICETACALGCRRIELDSAVHRIEAHEFYERRGFEKSAMHFSKTLSE